MAAVSESPPARRPLSSYLPDSAVPPDELLTRFLDWCAQAGFAARVGPPGKHRSVRGV